MPILVAIVGREALKTLFIVGAGVVLGKLATMKRAEVDVARGTGKGEWC